MAYDFEADSSQLDTISTDLANYADSFDEQIGNLYTEIDNIPWSGDDYDAFKEGAEGYKTAMSDLSDGIRLFSKHFASISEDLQTTTADALVNTIKDLLGNGGGSTSGSSSTGDTSMTDSSDSNTDDNSTGEIPEGAVDNGDGTYTLTETDGNSSGATTTETTYDEDGNIISTTVTRQDANGKQVVTNENGVETIETYDTSGNLTSKVTKDGNTTTKEEYGSDGSKAVTTTTENEDGTVTTKEEEYDEHGKKTYDNTSTKEGSGDSSTTTQDTQIEDGETKNIMTSGQEVSINGDTYHVYGYVKGSDGSSVGVYEGTDGYLYYMDSNGDLQNVMVNTTTYYSGGGGYSTPINSQEKATADSLTTEAGYGYTKTGKNFVIDGIQYNDGEVYASGESGSNVTAKDDGTVTSYNHVSEGEVTTSEYVGMNTSNNGDTVTLAKHNGSSTTLSVPGNYNEFKKAVENQQPIKLQDGHSLFYDELGPDNRNYGQSGDTYFVYHDGYYYEADANGNILNYSDKLDPNVLAGEGFSNDTTLN